MIKLRLFPFIFSLSQDLIKFLPLSINLDELHLLDKVFSLFMFREIESTNLFHLINTKLI